jgi:hypothetical protein
MPWDICLQFTAEHNRRVCSYLLHILFIIHSYFRGFHARLTSLRAKGADQLDSSFCRRKFFTMNLKNFSTLSMGLLRAAPNLEGLQSSATMSNALKRPYNAMNGSIWSPLRYFQSWSSQHNSELFKVLTTKTSIKPMAIIRWKSSIKSAGVHTKLKPYS